MVSVSKRWAWFAQSCQLGVSTGGNESPRLSAWAWGGAQLSLFFWTPEPCTEFRWKCLSPVQTQAFLPRTQEEEGISKSLLWEHLHPLDFLLVLAALCWFLSLELLVRVDVWPETSPPLASRAAGWVCQGWVFVFLPFRAGLDIMSKGCFASQQIASVVLVCFFFSQRRAVTHSKWCFRLFQSFPVALIFTSIWFSAPGSTISAAGKGQLGKASTSRTALSLLCSRCRFPQLMFRF